MSDYFNPAGFPLARPRRLRQAPWARRLTQETRVHPSQLILPVFVLDGNGRREAVASMPGVHRESIDGILRTAEAASTLGVSALALFPVVDVALKCPQGREASNPEGLVPRAVAALKSRFPDLGVICDVALDPYTSHGQDGLLGPAGEVLNDETVAALVEQALMQAAAGADVVAPSDMMDGRVLAIRRALESAHQQNTQILAYSAKFASAFYGPFRDAVGSAAQLGKADKKTYQMNPANGREAWTEAAMDVAEGADMLMVKPGLPYLDVIRQLSEATPMPVLAYQVSGEYAMLKAAAQAGWLDERSTQLEALTCLIRAGARGVLTYAALDLARWLRDEA